MMEDEQKTPKIFSESRRPQDYASLNGPSTKDWWLKVNYAEVIEVRDSVGIKALRARKET